MADSEARPARPDPSPGAAPSEAAEAPEEPAAPLRCASHPSVETYLRCGRCDRPICPRCLIQTPVGARCRECARLRRLPMFEVGPLDYLKGIGAGLAASYGAGLVLTLALAAVPYLGIVGLLLLLGLGYIVGEAVSRATRLKRGTGLGIVAALAVPVGLILGRATLLTLAGAPLQAALVGGVVSLAGSLWAFFGLLVAAAIAYTRVR